MPRLWGCITGDLRVHLSLMAPTKEIPTKGDPQEAVLAWRREMLVRAGCTDEVAEEIAASDADLHRTIAMLEAGCPPELAAKILI